MLENLGAIQQDYEQNVAHLLQTGKFDAIVKYYGTKEARNNTDPVFQFFCNYALAEANLKLGKAKIAGGYNKKAAQFCDNIAEEDPDFASDWDNKITQQRQQIDELLKSNPGISSSTSLSTLTHVTAEQLGHLSMSSSSTSSTSSSSSATSESIVQTAAPAPIPSSASMKEDLERARLLSSAPFTDITKLIDVYNHAIQTNDQRLAGEIGDAIRRYLFAEIKASNHVAIWQSLSLMSCVDIDMIRQLIEQLLQQIDQCKLTFPSLYETLTLSIKKSEDGRLMESDIVQITQLLSEKLNTLHASDLRLSCIVIQSMLSTLATMEEKNIQHVAKVQQDRVLNAIESLDKRLSAIRPRNEQEQYWLENIAEAVKHVRHLLRHTSDEKTTTSCYGHRAKRAGLLLLQTAEVGAAWFGATGSMGVGAPNALGATYLLASNVIRTGKEAWRYYKDNKPYFMSLTEWQTELDKYLNAMATGNTLLAEQGFKQLLERLKNPKTQDEQEKYWTNPHFQEGVITILMMLWDNKAYPHLHRPIIGLLSHYHQWANTQGECYTLVRQQAALCLLNLEKYGQIKGLAYEDIIETIDDKDKQLFEELHKNIAHSMYNLAQTIWKQAYPGDVRLFALISQPAELTPTQLKCIRKMKAGTHTEQCSSWGQAILDTFTESQLTLLETTVNSLISMIDATFKGITTDVSITLELYETIPELARQAIQLAFQQDQDTNTATKLYSDPIVFKQKMAVIKQCTQQTSQVSMAFKYADEIIGCRVFPSEMDQQQPTDFDRMEEKSEKLTTALRV
jgi:hypothetical protein